ncbi:MAG: hypothetical protein A3D18_02720 [Chlamydiae bacterium RIFCSPHIGHO2_02_FULL_49_29]|nr:MAG: hypothetical protein A3D18_02720 [Chlamydiae bacterium RIFCSPHIGHO2_02_FULL_49_29]
MTDPVEPTTPSQISQPQPPPSGIGTQGNREKIALAGIAKAGMGGLLQAINREKQHEAQRKKKNEEIANQ